MERRWLIAVVLVALALSACGGPSDPNGGGTNGDVSVRDYVVGPGSVATVTSIQGVIEGYDGGAVDATFAGFGGSAGPCPSDDAPCFVFWPGGPWVPTSIDAQGRFTVALPASVPPADLDVATFCGETVPLSFSGAVYLHDAPFGEAGSFPTTTFVRIRVEDPKEPYGMLADASVLVWYAFTTSTADLTCTETMEEFGLDELVLDADVRLRPGWNVMTWLQRSEGDDMVLYMRTGAPGMPVPWIEPEPLY